MTIADLQVQELRFPPKGETLEAERGAPVPSTSYSLYSDMERQREQRQSCQTWAQALLRLSLGLGALLL